MPPPTSKDEKQPTQLDKIMRRTTLFLILFVVVGILTGVIFGYYWLATVPEMPKVDLEQWWGPYPVNPLPDRTIRPFKIEFSDVVVNDLRERLLHRRPFPPPLENTGFTYGFNSHFLDRVLEYWKNSYNFEEREQFLNMYDQFVTNVQGLDIHFMHVKPKVEDDLTVVPILLLHGWPGSIREFYELIPSLTDRRPGYKFVFEVIAPSLPGFGFSQAADRPGLGAMEIAVIFRNLMKQIGHERYYVQGGDAGHTIGSIMATLFPENILGFHTNMPIAIRLDSMFKTMLKGYMWPPLMVEPKLSARIYSQLAFLMEESGYVHLQATKPDTVGIALTDSPAGLAAYILEKFSTWTNPAYKIAGDGNLLAKFSLTHLLDNIMIYWVTNSITTSMRLYAETMNTRHCSLYLDHIPTEVPTWGIKFKHELIFVSDAILKEKYKNYLHSTVVEDGGHFAALENPQIMATDIYEAVETFREFHGRNNNLEGKPLADNETGKTIYDFTIKDINGKMVKLEKYRGFVLIIVNVASQCGLTDTNYRQLNELYEKYYSRDLRILAFPCNQFGGQEPGNLKDILKFTKEREVKFDVFEKIEVNGENAHPLWKFLKKSQGGMFGDSIKWNFSKFIIDRKGIPVERLSPTVNPLDLEIYLAKYW